MTRKPDKDLPSKMPRKEFEELAEVAKKINTHFKAKVRQTQHNAVSDTKPLNRQLAQKAKNSVIAVGDGRGFVVNGRRDRLVVTAAHCLPFFPPCHGASGLEERTYGSLLAPLGKKAAISVECMFADPIADIAVLGPPDNQELSKEADACEAFVESAAPIAIADAPEKGRGWLLSLDQKWFACAVEYNKRLDGPLLISKPEQPIAIGMSGSPVISDDGVAIGIVCLGKGVNPRLIRDLPGWLLNATIRALSQGSE
jgi:hypothetical protein